jgi:hypothetical protein
VTESFINLTFLDVAKCSISERVSVSVRVLFERSAYERRPTFGICARLNVYLINLMNGVW